MVKPRWADLASLADHPIGRDAITDFEIQERVVRHKAMYFSDPHADYEACLSGGLRLAPAPERRKVLARDYLGMEGMFQGTPPPLFE